MEIHQNNIIMKEELNKKDYAAIKNLQDTCFEKQKIELKLELDYKIRQRINFVGNKIMAEFLYYENKILVGYLGLCNFGGATVEINGMVHPRFRKRGIFKKLYLIAREEWIKTSNLEVVALCDHMSSSGIAFINSLGAEYATSEYKMCFNKKNSDVIHNYVIKLRVATSKDVTEIDRQTSIYFGNPKGEIDIGVQASSDQLNDNFINYMAELDGKVIGKIHINITNNDGFLYGFGVLPEFRGRGYAREILSYTLDILNKKKLNNIFLEVSTQNKKALDLYESCGFDEISVMDYYIVY